ncbi:hypothetical protein ACTFIW_011287 [Dictyostelium discoideum]
MSIYHGIIGSSDHIQNIFPPPSPRKNISLSTNNISSLTTPKNFTTIVVTKPLSQSTTSTQEMMNTSDILFDIQQPLSPQHHSRQIQQQQQQQQHEKITPEEEERRSDELQKILLDTIPILIKGVETLGIEVEQICNGDSANEKRSNCQVLVDIQKTLREYPRGMGYRSKTIPSNIVGKPKLIAFRHSMDQLVWENISKLSILKDFVEFTLDFQKLCVIGISIRDAINSFVNNKCEYLIKGFEFNNTTSILSGINIHHHHHHHHLTHQPGASTPRPSHSSSSHSSSHSLSSSLPSSLTSGGVSLLNTSDDAIVPSLSSSGNDDSSLSSSDANVISINISTVIQNGVRDEINNTSISALKKSQKQQPVVLSRAPKQVMESTRILVDTVVNRKCMYREEKASIYREMMNDRLTLLKEDPKKFKQQLLQQRRQKLTNSDQPHETDYNEDFNLNNNSTNNNNNIKKESNGSSVNSQTTTTTTTTNNNNNNNISPQHSGTSGSPSDKENSPIFSPGYLSTSPPKSPPKSPEFLGVPIGKKAHLLGHARSFSADTHATKESAANQHHHSHNNIGSVLSPPLSSQNERILRNYKLLSSSPSSSSSAVVTNPVSLTTQLQQQQQQQQTTTQPTQPPPSEYQLLDLEWEEPIDSDFILPCKGYKIDSGNSRCQQVNYDELIVLYTDEDEYHYCDDFCSLEHFNFLGVNKNQPDNPMCISVVVQHDTNELLYIIRTGEKDEKYRLSLPYGKKEISSKDMLKMIKKSRFNQMSNFKLKEVKSDQNQQFIKQLIQFEAKNIHKTFKFGVLYCSENQGTDENELYSNSSTSDEFQEFLRILGDRVQLQGWTKYRGGLDIKDNTTGTHSIYKKWRDFEIMYHVAPMIPCRAADEQSVERKRHLGNDIVLIIYKEGNTKLFDPSIIKSNFNHIFAVVQKVDPIPNVDGAAVINLGNSFNNNNNSNSDSNLPTTTINSNNLPIITNVNYKISIGCKEEVQNFGPAFPKNHIFSTSTGENLTDFLLTRLINGERATLKSPVFAQKLKRTRKEFLHSFITDFGSE